MLDRINPYTLLPALSLNGPNSMTNETAIPKPCLRSGAAKQTRILVGCYRKGDAVDPEVYVTSGAAVLANYPESVVMMVTNPIHGIPGSMFFSRDSLPPDDPQTSVPAHILAMHGYHETVGHECVREKDALFV